VTIYDFVTAITDKRLPPFAGSGVRREGAQISYGPGKGMLFLSQCLVLTKRNGKWVATNEACMEAK
jgi:hypothetical protein